REGARVLTHGIIVSRSSGVHLPLKQGSKLLPPHFCPKRCMHFVCFPPCFHEKPYILLSPTTFSRTHPASLLTLSGRPCTQKSLTPKQITLINILKALTSTSWGK